MDKRLIGEWAGQVWRLLSTENRKWAFEEVRQRLEMNDKQLAAAIGWLAREDKIMFEMPHGENDANVSLILNVYIG